MTSGGLGKPIDPTRTVHAALARVPEKLNIPRPAPVPDARGIWKFLLGYSINGSLQVSKEGIKWRPGAIARRAHMDSILIGWPDLRAADFVPAFAGRGGPSSTLLTLESRAGSYSFVMGSEDAQSAIEQMRPYMNEELA